jgi:hypothetical protein
MSPSAVVTIVSYASGEKSLKRDPSQQSILDPNRLCTGIPDK